MSITKFFEEIQLIQNRLETHYYTTKDAEKELNDLLILWRTSNNNDRTD